MCYILILSVITLQKVVNATLGYQPRAVSSRAPGQRGQKASGAPHPHPGYLSVFFFHLLVLWNKHQQIL